MIRESKVTTIPCERCGGTGILPGPQTGRLLKRMRESRGVTFPQLLKFFPYKKTYTFDLENDDRPWTNEKVVQYKQAVEDAVKYRLENFDANGS